jgi:hypothetical protein
MIGDKLSYKDMGRVVGQLAEIEQPWVSYNHSRPLDLDAKGSAPVRNIQIDTSV